MNHISPQQNVYVIYENYKIIHEIVIHSAHLSGVYRILREIKSPYILKY